MMNEETQLKKTQDVLNSAANALTNFPELEGNVIGLIKAQINIVQSYLNEYNRTTGMMEKYVAVSKAYASAGSLNITLAYLVW